MSAVRLYMDEDSMTRSLVRGLRARGVDVTTALDEGMVERDDAEHLAYATAQGGDLYTFNVANFYRLHAEYLAAGKEDAGMILVRQQRDSVGEQMRRVLKLIGAKTAEQMKNTIEFLSAWQ